MKERAKAHIFEKWVRGIRATIAEPAERCAVYEYIIAYQLRDIYGIDRIEVGELSERGQAVADMLTGDLEELCEELRTRNEQRKTNLKQSRQKADTEPTPNRHRTDTEPTPNPNGLPNTIQSKAIQSNTIQSNTTSKGLLAFEDIFAVGLALIRRGLLVDAQKLVETYKRGTETGAANIVGYCAAAQKPNPNKPCAECIANMLELSRCKTPAALEILNLHFDDNGKLGIVCTAAAAAALEPHKAGLQQYCSGVGADSYELIYNGKI